MKSKGFVVASLLTLGLVIFIYTGCKKDDETTNTNQNADAEKSQAEAENVINDVFTQIDTEASKQKDLSNTNEPKSYEATTCAPAVTITPKTLGQETPFPRILTVDFGTTGCKGEDGKIRKGKITAEFSGKYDEKGTKVVISTTDYTVNGYKVSGSKAITVVEPFIGNTNTNPKYTIKVTNAIITNPDGKTHTWCTERTREMTEGKTTINRLDDQYTISGWASGTDVSGKSYTATISSNDLLLVKMNCKWITKGTIIFAKEDKLPRTISFGDGTCDNKATITIAGNEFNYEMN